MTAALADLRCPAQAGPRPVAQGAAGQAETGHQPPAWAYTVAVRELCEFAAKQGDLDLRFTPSPTSQQGIAGHKTVAARRSADYCTELPLRASYKHLVISGRADGFDAQQQLLEEVKTFKGDLDLMPANHRHLHLAQAKVYAAMARSSDVFAAATF